MIDTTHLDWAWHLAGWTMIHYLWIGGLIGVVAYLLRLPIRRRTPNLRYALTLACFFALAAAPVGIATWLASDAQFAASYAFSNTTEEVSSRETLPIETAKTQAVGESNERAEPTNQVIDLADNPIVLSAQSSANSVSHTESDPVSFTSSPGEISRETPRPTAAFDFHSLQFYALLASITAIAPWIWLIGTPLTFLLLAGGLIGAKRLRRTARVMHSGTVYDLTQRLRKAAGVSRQVTVAVSDRVLQPVLVGIVRPLILLPPAAVSGWSPAQLEMALLHELTHVRRWDNLVNLLQRVVESLLFFQPAVWIVSRWLRADREQCCDAAVVRHTGEPEAYAELLVSVAQNSLNPRLPSTAVALARHPLSTRIRRILQLEDDPMLISRSTFGVTGVLLAAVAGLLLWQPAPLGVAQESDNVIELKEESRVVPDLGEGVPGADTSQLTTERTEITEEEIETDGDSRSVPAPDGVPHDSPFLPLDQQRIADLVYKMLKVEIAPLDEKLLPAVREQRFAGGVLIESGANGGRGFGEMGGGPFFNGDIIVGLHVWPTANFDQLAEVLRRDDLMEFTPLKYYVLRPIAPPPPTARGGGRGGRGMGEFGGGMGMGGEFGGRRGGGEMDGGFGGGRSGFGETSGRGGEFGADLGGGFDAGGGSGGEEFGGGDAFAGGMDSMGGRGGFGRRTPAAQAAAERPAQKYELITGRIAIPGDEWRDEQARLEREREQRNDATPAASPVGIPSALLRHKQLLKQREQAVERDLQREREQQQLEQLHERRERERARERESNSPDKTLLYDGRTFDDWSTQWKNELKVEKRIEAIEALAAFGRAGDGERAAKAILDVAAEYDYQRSTDSERELLQHIDNALAKNIPAADWFSLLENLYNENPEKWSWLAAKIVPTIRDPELREQQTGLLLKLATSDDQSNRIRCFSYLVDLNPQLTDPRIRKLVEQTLESAADDSQIYAVYAVLRAEETRDLDDVLVKLSREGTEKTKKSIRSALNQKHDSPGTQAMLKKFVASLNSPEDEAHRLDTIRYIGAIGSGAKEAESELAKFLKSNDPAIQVAAATALERIKQMGVDHAIATQLLLGVRDVDALTQDGAVSLFEIVQKEFQIMTGR